MLIAVRELTIEIRAYCKVFIAIISLFPLPLNLILLMPLIELYYF